MPLLAVLLVRQVSNRERLLPFPAISQPVPGQTGQVVVVEPEDSRQVVRGLCRMRAVLVAAHRTLLIREAAAVGRLAVVAELEAMGNQTLERQAAPEGFRLASVIPAAVARAATTARVALMVCGQVAVRAAAERTAAIQGAELADTSM